MSTDIFGLPAHPLMVHAPIILVPVTFLCVVTYVFMARVRRQLGWLVVVSTAVTIPAVAAARWSGQQLAAARMDELAGNDTAANEAAASINHHAQYGDMLIWLVAAIAPVAWLFCALVSGRVATLAQARSWHGLHAWVSTDSDNTQRAVTSVVVGTVLVVLAAACLANVVFAGHSGASMVWGA